MGTSEKLIVGGFATVIGISMLSQCSNSRQDKSLSNWENSQGTQGFINLNDVRDAFRSTQKMADFESRVNEIFEGDNMVVFEAKEIRGGFKLMAREDLDGSKSTTAKDDLLFTLSVEGRTAQLKGAGVNKYYKESWIYEPPAGSQQQVQQVHHRSSSIASSPFFWWWVLSPGWGGYYTPIGRYDSMYSHRNSYRSSSSYRSQMTRNGKFGTSMSQKHGSSFRSAVNSPSSNRKSYIRTQPKSAGFKEKLAASKKTTGTSKKSQLRSTSGKSRSFSGTSSRSSRSSSSRSYGGYRGSSGFGI